MLILINTIVGVGWVAPGRIPDTRNFSHVRDAALPKVNEVLLEGAVEEGVYYSGATIIEVLVVTL